MNTGILFPDRASLSPDCPATRILLVALAVVGLAGAAIASAGPPPPIPSAAAREALVGSHQASSAPGGGETRAVHDEYDVAHYDVDLGLNIPLRVLTGTVTVQAVSSVADLASLGLDLFTPMVVDGVTVNGAAAPWTHANGVVTVTLDRPYQPAEAFTVAVRYHGTPSYQGSPFRWNTHSGAPMVLTYSEPYGAPAWWVCKDDPKDKAPFTIHVTAPDTLITVSNGVLDSVDYHPNRTATYNWTHDYPMSPYLFSIATTNFDSWSDLYIGLDGTTTMRVDYFAYPEDMDKALVDWEHNIEMMGYYAGIFGEYPFLTEKYAIAEFAHTGAMEHQTATSMGFPWLTGDNRNDFVVAHELSHSWVGDMITMRTWAHAWTKEGFATLCEALYFEHLYGEAYYHEYMDGMNPLGYAIQQLYNINPPLSSAIYYKGAWVLHMLRHLIGEEAFWNGVRHYTGDPALRYGSGDTEDLRRAFEATSGRDLVWFFDEWIYHPGYPKFVPFWNSARVPGGWEAYLTLQQSQTVGPIFKMPIDLDVVTDLGPERFVVWDSLQTQSFTLRVQGRPQSILIDPDHWLIWSLDATVQVPDVDLAPVTPGASLRFVPNPVRAGSPAALYLSLPQEGRARVLLFDAGGRLVRSLFDAETGAGVRRVLWDGRDGEGNPVPGGVYYHRIEQGGKVRGGRVVLVR